MNRIWLGMLGCATDDTAGISGAALGASGAAAEAAGAAGLATLGFVAASLSASRSAFRFACRSALSFGWYEPSSFDDASDLDLAYVIFIDLS
eukprot:7385594-Prymnesium_polylepis.1